MTGRGLPVQVARGIADARRWSRHVDRRVVARFTGGWILNRLTRRALSASTPPTVNEMVAAGGGLNSTAGQLLARLGWPEAASRPLQDEFAAVAEALGRRYQEANLEFPLEYGIQQETAFFLYAASRLLRPQTVVETGVANGHSSFVILAALRRNGSGRLHSIDIRPQAGVLVEDREGWDLVIADLRRPEASLLGELDRIGPVDLFFHDSDHRYLAQLFEYRAAWARLRPGGLLASDDANDSRAFTDFCGSVGVRPEFLVDRTKVIGACRTALPTPAGADVRPGRANGER